MRIKLSNELKDKETAGIVYVPPPLFSNIISMLQTYRLLVLSKTKPICPHEPDQDGNCIHCGEPVEPISARREVK
jgi:hypothetical protein